MRTKIDLVKPIWKYSDNKLLQIPKFELEHKTLGKLRVNVYNHANNLNNFSCKITDTKNEKLGINTFGLNENKNVLLGFYMQTHIGYRGEGLGELLRLISIMILDKNKNNAIDIFSKEGAIYFHAKYKFVPNVKAFIERNFALKDIASDKTPELKKIALEAGKLLDKISYTKDSAELRNINKPANKCIKEYIGKVIKNGNINEHKFNYGFEMQLNNENIIKNKEFFNELFKKHGIDYKL